MEEGKRRELFHERRYQRQRHGFDIILLRYFFKVKGANSKRYFTIVPVTVSVLPSSEC